MKPRPFKTDCSGPFTAALKCVRENLSAAPSGLDLFPLAPTAYAVGCTPYAASRLPDGGFVPLHV